MDAGPFMADAHEDFNAPSRISLRRLSLRTPYPILKSTHALPSIMLHPRLEGCDLVLFLPYSHLLPVLSSSRSLHIQAEIAFCVMMNSHPIYAIPIFILRCIVVPNVLPYVQTYSWASSSLVRLSRVYD